MGEPIRLDCVSCGQSHRLLPRCSRGQPAPPWRPDHGTPGGLLLVRRLLTGSLAFLALTGTVLVAPVYASPGPEAEPVPTSTDEVALGSVEDPAPAADVQEGTSEPVAGVAETAPTLTVTKTGVPEFSLIGVTWAHDPAVTDTVVKVRVQDGAGAWGEWTEVGTETA